MKREVFTLALGKSLYVEMALNLARSFRLWNSNTDIAFRLVTDWEGELPASLSFVEIQKASVAELGEGFSSKLKLDRLCRADRSLFIDADCLCVGSLESVFETFEGTPVGVVGRPVTGGEWFGNLDSILPKLGIDSIPKFNGGVYYVKKGGLATTIFDTSRALEPRYDEIGLVRLRERPNDELLIALALGEHGVRPVPDDGGIMADLFSFPARPEVDVIRGKSRLVNPPLGCADHQSWNPLNEASPRIVHFLGDSHGYPEYRAEALALRLIDLRLPRSLAWLSGRLFLLWPGRLRRFFKNWMRPLYRKFLGVRPVKTSDRI
ncbi:MAG: hypothetical protein ABIT76_00720 [Chthoniobacterales bacterium]